MKLDKIRVLLIDDEPHGLSRRKQVDGQPYYTPAFGAEAGKPQAIEGIEELFELRWLATVEESREFRDLSSLMAVKQPQALGADGWVPEILCFDYMMKPGHTTVRPVEERLPEALSGDLTPLPDLRHLAQRWGVQQPAVSSPPPLERGGHDSFGCYCGGLIFSLFSDHPCAPVALTVHDNVTAGTDATFFEWFLELDGGDAFRQKSRRFTLSWQQLLYEGVERLRNRILELIRNNQIDLDLKVLMALASGEVCDGLLLHSRFGSRHLPLRGLFCDIAEPLRQEEATRWAQRCLETLFAGIQDTASGARQALNPASKALEEFREADSFCLELWKEYLSDRSVRRYRLSELAHRFKQGPLTGEDEDTFDQLCREFGVDQAKIGGRQDPPCERFHEIRSRPEASQRMKRWTALLMAIRLELWAASCRQAWRHHHQENGFDGILDLALTPISEDDIYLALFPVPKTPLVTGFHDGQSRSSAWGRFIKPPVSDSDASLGLDLKELLKGSGWKAADDKDVGCSPCGLLSGEAQVLRWFAQSESIFRQEFLDEITWLQGKG